MGNPIPCNQTDQYGNDQAPRSRTIVPLDFATGQCLTVSSSAVLSAPVSATEVYLKAEGAMYVTVGSSGAVAAASSGSVYMADGEGLFLGITSGQCVSAVRKATDGKLYIVPVT